MGAIVAVVAIGACGPPAAGGPTASSSAAPSPSAPASASPTVSVTPTGQPAEAKLTCGSRPVAGHRLLLLQANFQTPESTVVDVSDPLKPIPVCRLRPSSGGRFTSATTIAFWFEQHLGSANLASGAVAWTAELPVTVGPGAAALSADGSAFAYTIDSETAGTSTHLYVGHTDRTLFTEPMLGGHGGPPYGPVGQLEFSADGRYLLQYELFRPQPAPPNFLVYARDGSLAFQSASAKFGAWAPSGSTLYFLVSGQPGGIGGEVHSWTPSGSEVIVARGLTTYFWPRAAPDGRVLVFDSYDTSAPGEATGGLPHLWQVDLGTGTARQLSTASSTKTVFVGATSLWSDEETRCSCGPGGASMPTGRVLAHDLASGRDAVVDLTAFTLSPSSVRVVLDVSPN